MNIKSSQKLVEEAIKSIETLKAEEVKKLAENKEITLIDVRDIRELWKEGTIENSKHIPLGVLISVIIFFELIIVIGGWKFKPEVVSSISLAFDDADISNTHSIGNVLYTDYIHLFQLSGMILLVAMIGAIVLTFRKRSGLKRQSYFSQISRERSDSVKLIEVESNKGVNIDD